MTIEWHSTSPGNWSAHDTTEYPTIWLSVHTHIFGCAWSAEISAPMVGQVGVRVQGDVRSDIDEAKAVCERIAPHDTPGVDRGKRAAIVSGNDQRRVRKRDFFEAASRPPL